MGVTYLAALAACLLAHAAPAPTAGVHAAQPQAPLAGPLAEIRPLEVRIRKLFLVRPDLLQYPVPYDTVC